MSLPGLAFRFRLPIVLLLYLLGFLLPWERFGGGSTLWLAASTELARSQWVGLELATLTVTIIALCSLVAASLLRVWGTAYLGSATVQGARFEASQCVEAGPYRHVRNPLYLGSGLLALAVSILLAPAGALFFLGAQGLFLRLLVCAEERSLAAALGEPYRQYCRRVPRFFPRLTKDTVDLDPTSHPRWLQALFAETFPIAFTLCFAIFAWRYNSHVLAKCLLVCFGLSLVVRACIKTTPQTVDRAVSGS